MKNWSLITRDEKVELAPAYDLLNTTIPNPRSGEELALPLHGKTSNLRANDFWRYLAEERLGFTPAQVEETRARLAQVSSAWPRRITASFLSDAMKERYLVLLPQRRARLELA